MTKAVDDTTRWHAGAGRRFFHAGDVVKLATERGRRGRLYRIVRFSAEADGLCTAHLTATRPHPQAGQTKTARCSDLIRVTTKET